MKSEIIAVVGAGTMGSGIAEVFAIAGYPCLVCDVSEEVLARRAAAISGRLQRLFEKGRLSEQPQLVISRLSFTTSVQELKDADFVVEAVVEKLEVKQALFQKLDEVCKPGAVLATNTSSLSVTEIAGAIRRPERVIGVHFFNPVPVMPLVEIVATRFSSPDAVELGTRLVEGAGKKPVRVKDTPGFIVNRVARPFYNEALRIVGDCIASTEQVDRIMRSAGFAMGPFELQDLIGIDINYAATVATYEAFFEDPRFRPHPLHRSMVQGGTLGRKTGRGYYSYDSE